MTECTYVGVCTGTRVIIPYPDQRTQKQARYSNESDDSRAAYPPPPPVGAISYRPQVYVWGHNLGSQCGTGKAGNLAKPTVPQVRRFICVCACANRLTYIQQSLVLANIDVFNGSYIHNLPQLYR